jgi:hypothetical protein
MMLLDYSLNVGTPDPAQNRVQADVFAEALTATR